MMSTIPIDLVLEIFSRLPAKSIKRFCCVSKLLKSMLRLPCFTELFLTRSCARPRLLFALGGANEKWSIYSSPQPHNLYGESSLVVTADFHMKFKCPRRNKWDSPTYFPGVGTTSGLISISSKSGITSKSGGENIVICNPSTGQYASLPHLRTYGNSTTFLGFDPVDKLFKVLSSCNLNGLRILTLGTGGDMRWREIQSPAPHWPKNRWICINGVLYYLAKRIPPISSYVIVCFDVRSEKFKFIDAGWFSEWFQLINYKGKLGGIILKYDWSEDPDYWPEYMSMWVLDDVENQEWSEYVYTLPDNTLGGSASLIGVMATGEIVLAINYTFPSKSFYVSYFHPKRNTLLTVEIKGFEVLSGCEVYTFIDHVENLNVPDAELFSSISYAREGDMARRSDLGEEAHGKKQRRL